MGRLLGRGGKRMFFYSWLFFVLCFVFVFVFGFVLVVFDVLLLASVGL